MLTIERQAGRQQPDSQAFMDTLHVIAVKDRPMPGYFAACMRPGPRKKRQCQVVFSCQASHKMQDVHGLTPLQCLPEIIEIRT